MYLITLVIVQLFFFCLLIFHFLIFIRLISFSICDYSLSAINCRIWPAVLRQATYGTIKFGTYYTLKKVFTEKGFLIDKHGNERVWCNVLCAVIGNLHFN